MINLFTSRFAPDKEFSGAEHGQRREGPVQFEEDPFGLDKFLKKAKQHDGSKRLSTSTRSKDDYHDKKRRKEWEQLEAHLVAFFGGRVGCCVNLCLIKLYNMGRSSDKVCKIVLFFSLFGSLICDDYLWKVKY